MSVCVSTHPQQLHQGACQKQCDKGFPDIRPQSKHRDRGQDDIDACPHPDPGVSGGLLSHLCLVLWSGPALHRPDPENEPAHQQESGGARHGEVVTCKALTAGDHAGKQRQIRDGEEHFHGVPDGTRTERVPGVEVVTLAQYPVTMTRTPTPAGRAVVTITPAPALDLTYRVGTLHPGKIHRAIETGAEFAGKGVNVTCDLTLGGIDSRAVVPLAPSDHALIADDPRLVASPAALELRRNVTIIDSVGQTTKVNQQASSLSAKEWDALCETALAEVRSVDASWLVISGRIPPVEADLTGFMQELRVRLRPDTSIAVDISGDLLAPWWRSGVVDFVKPNVAELSEVVGHELTTLGDVVDAAEALQRGGITWVAVSLGADGFLAATPEETVWAVSDPITVANTIGAGDASVAGFLHALVEGLSASDAAVRAAEWGALNASQATSQLTALAPVVPVRLVPIERTRPVQAD